MEQTLRSEARLISYEKCDLVTLVATGGNRSVELAAHEERLFKSPFFCTALQRRWLEGQTRKIELPDDDFRTVEHYLDFLYTGQVSDKLWLEDLAQLYVFGQKMLDPAYKNAILARMLHDPKKWEDGEFLNPYESRFTVRIIYEGTPSASLGRRILVAIFHAIGNPKWLEFEFPTEFQQDLMAKFLGCRKRPKLCDLTLSTYMEEVEEVKW